jgi:hypothetical protein
MLLCIPLVLIGLVLLAVVRRRKPASGHAPVVKNG